MHNVFFLAPVTKVIFASLSKYFTEPVNADFVQGSNQVVLCLSLSLQSIKLSGSILFLHLPQAVIR